MWPSRTLQAEVYVCPTAGRRALVDQNRSRTEHSAEFERQLFAARSASQTETGVRLHLFVVDGVTQRAVAVTVASTQAHDLPPGVDLAFSATQVSPLLQRIHNAWYFVLDHVNHVAGPFVAYNELESLATVPAWAAPSLIRLMTLCRNDNFSVTGPPARVPTSGGGYCWKKARGSAQQVALVAFLRTFPSKQLFDQGQWLVVSASELRLGAAHYH
jgi:hypothetical protein